MRGNLIFFLFAFTELYYKILELNKYGHVYVKLEIYVGHYSHPSLENSTKYLLFTSEHFFILTGRVYRSYSLGMMQYEV